MDVSKLKRDAAKVHAYLKEAGDGSLITTKGCKIYIPSSYAECQLASVGNETHILGIFAIVVEDQYYGVSLANAMMRIEPSATNTVDVDGSSYIEFYFEPGATVIPALELVKEDTLTYHIYDEFIAKGHVPWFISYIDLGNLFASAPYHAGVKLGANHAVLELIASVVARDPKDRTLYYRQTVKSMDEVLSRPPALIPFRSVTYGATNTTAKLMGAYFDEGLTSALVNPSQRTEKIEELLRR